MYFLSSLEREPVLQLKRWSTYAPLFPFLLLLFVGAVYMLFCVFRVNWMLYMYFSKTVCQ